MSRIKKIAIGLVGFLVLIVVASLSNHSTKTASSSSATALVSTSDAPSPTLGETTAPPRVVVTTVAPTPTTTEAPVVVTSQAPTPVDTPPPTTRAYTPAPAPAPGGNLGTAPIQKPPSGNFYRAGEYCPEVDAGDTTEDAQGRTLTCENNNGLRWEH